MSTIRTPWPEPLETLWIVLGDQLDPDHPLFEQADPAHDAVWMAEVSEESTKVWSHKARIALFLSSMRHFAQQVSAQKIALCYTTLSETDNKGALDAQLKFDCQRMQPKRLAMVWPGEWDVLKSIQDTADALSCPLLLLPDEHFLSTPEDFRHYASGRKQLRMEFFYRQMRVRHHVLLDEAGGPEGGQWNFDHDNQGAFSKHGPGSVAPPMHFAPDALTADVLALVEDQFEHHPGSLAHFDWPVTPQQAQLALDDFIQHRLECFGQYQDAMWIDPCQDLPYLYHSRLSAALNLKLLNPRQVIQKAEAAYRSGRVSLASAEGFIRQILGWREYVRGIYWLYMPAYRHQNALCANAPLPSFYWSAKTDMACLQAAIRQSLDYGYAHHIQRLMVTGLFALLLGVHPMAVHRWYLAMYVDAVEWVELPNSLGMSQYGDGGIMASKPYIASGNYINRMSNACKQCRYDPAVRLGENACPFTTLYWAFLINHETSLMKNPRMGMQVRNLQRIEQSEKQAILQQAQKLRDTLTCTSADVV
ncbi:MAG: cryptochrome/photolyase family protein [Vampirovibrionales bacterium]|nr:cryptochrome/photolyase family protein [Vampirovibrionales bacterium]